MDRLRGLGSVARAHAMNEGTGRGDDLLPSF
jgi:type IV secretion system protein VirD4